MSTRTMRLALSLLVILSVALSFVTAGRLEDVAPHRGFNSKLRRTEPVENPVYLPRPVDKRAAATSSACVSSSPPNPTAPPSCGGNNCVNAFNKQFTASLDNLESFCSSWTSGSSAAFTATGAGAFAGNCIGTSTAASLQSAVASKVSSACDCYLPKQTSCPTTPGGGSSGYRFLNEDTKPYQVTSMPEVNYDIGEMYSGMMPINESEPDRSLFFVFQPTDGAPVDEITIWLNGGPGCSSLEGFFQENGRFIWSWGMYNPTFNPYSWVNLTNVLWVEQPIGTGFSQGKVRAQGEEDIAREFADFFKNFQKKFGIKKFKIFVTGESYAGRYVPYISAEMLNRNDTTYYNVKGALVYDPTIGATSYTQEEAPAYPFVEYYNNIIGLNSSFMATLKGLDESCGYAAYREKYYTFPAAGIQPAPPRISNACDINGLASNAAFNLNPCFNSYEINTQCPMPSDPLGFPTNLAYQYPGLTPLYFDRADVKAAMHAPTNVQWQECGGPVFVRGDTSIDPIRKVLPQVIEATNRVLVSNANLDMVIITQGTLLAIQNMTWGGTLGFTSKPEKPIVITLPDLQYQQTFVDNGYPLGFEDPQGTMGVQHYERGLMWAETFLSGHMQPQFQPRSSYRHLQWLLGHIEEL